MKQKICEISYFEAFPTPFTKFFDSLHLSGHLADSLRLSNFGEYKKRSNWPFNSELNYGNSEHKTLPPWKILETRKARDAVLEYCHDQAKTYTEIRIVNILNKIQLITDPDEFQKVKYVREVNINILA